MKGQTPVKDVAVASACGGAITIVVGGLVFGREAMVIGAAQHHQGWMILTVPIFAGLGLMYGLAISILCAIPALITSAMAALAGRSSAMTLLGFAFSAGACLTLWFSQAIASASIAESPLHALAVLGPVAAVISALFYLFNRSAGG